MRRILVVEDDVPLARMLEEYLTPEGYDVALLHDGADVAAAKLEEFDLVVLDLMLPNRSGFDLLRDIRKTSELPVILLTARDTETDRVVGLELGADDYVPKPFKPRELVARMRAVLRRADRALPPMAAVRALRVGEVSLDAAGRVASCAGVPLDLTSAEFALLECLLRHAGQPVSRDDLAEAALGRTARSSLDRNVDTVVSKLRRKLGECDHIKTVRNIGYLFALPAV
ncbi:MAG TPA: response regulator transcription factor [Acetobacteraceae bacterium]|nr:response regulator transcription factor [Acetobacteraceae bacterium]